mgnify:CR=1 FL=1
MESQNFRRIEIKYLLTKKQYNLLFDKLSKKVVQDKHGKSTICNLYFDTKNYDLIRASIEKPVYKEKVRLRSYSNPSMETYVFLEIKKKYKGIVTKNRIKIRLEEVYKYAQNKDKNFVNSYTFKQIDYMFEKYNLLPVVYIAYDRRAYFLSDDENFRVTFDFNIRYRTEDIGLENGDSGKLLLKNDECIMEVKTLDSLPIWFVEILSEFKIYPSSFSKYGNVYKKMLLKERGKK